MVENVSEIAVDDFVFKLLGDPARPGEIVVEIYKSGRPFENLRGEPMRKSFPARASTAHIERFCRRFAADDGYRTSIMVRDNFSCC